MGLFTGCVHMKKLLLSHFLSDVSIDYCQSVKKDAVFKQLQESNMLEDSIFQPVIHIWGNVGCGGYYYVSGMMHI